MNIKNCLLTSHPKNQTLPKTQIVPLEHIYKIIYLSIGIQKQAFMTKLCINRGLIFVTALQVYLKCAGDPWITQ